jgi:hypothetical protein
VGTLKALVQTKVKADLVNSKFIAAKIQKFKVQNSKFKVQKFKVQKFKVHKFKKVQKFISSRVTNLPLNIQGSCSPDMNASLTPENHVCWPTT